MTEEYLYHPDIYADAKEEFSYPDWKISFWRPVLRKHGCGCEKAIYWRTLEDKAEAIQIAENYLARCRDEKHESLTFHGHWNR